MTDPITFATLPNGRIEASFNDVLVGEVAPWPYGGRSLDKAITVFRMFLPVLGAVEPPAQAQSLAGARRTLLHRLADWHEQADPVRYASMIIDLRRQSEGERG